jgi:hypothetical protein
MYVQPSVLFVFILIGAAGGGAAATAAAAATATATTTTTTATTATTATTIHIHTHTSVSVHGRLHGTRAVYVHRLCIKFLGNVHHKKLFLDHYENLFCPSGA